MSRDAITIDWPGTDESAPCVCGSCDWRGTIGDLHEAEGAILTAGDAAPAGRCPDPGCGALAYLDRPLDRARDAAEVMLAALERIVTVMEGVVPPVLRRPDDSLAEARAAIAAAKGEG